MEKVKCEYCGKMGRSGTKCHVCSRIVQTPPVQEEVFIVDEVEECCEECEDCVCVEEETAEEDSGIIEYEEDPEY